MEKHNKTDREQNFVFTRSPNYAPYRVSNVRVSMTRRNIVLEPAIHLPPLPFADKKSPPEVQLLNAYFLDADNAKSLLRKLHKAIDEMEKDDERENDDI